MLPPRWQRVLDDLDRCEEESESIREAPMLGCFVVMSRIGRCSKRSTPISIERLR